jgi:carbon-monoxide dehydrogenase medium subunit
VRVRNVATVGGALAHGDPHMDLPPVLMALGATLHRDWAQGERKLAVEDLFAGYYETVLEKNELIAEVHVPAQGKKKASYFKVTTGPADDWPALGVAAVIDGDGKAIKSCRLVASAATDKATRLKSAGGAAQRQERRRQAAATSRRSRARRLRVHRRRARLGAVQARIDEGLRSGARLQPRSMARTDWKEPTDGRHSQSFRRQGWLQVGRSVPRLEAR